MIDSWTPREFLLRISGVLLAKADRLEEEAVIASFHRAAQNEKRYRPDKIFNAEKFRKQIEHEKSVKYMPRLLSAAEKAQLNQDILNMFNEDNFRVRR